MFERMFSGGVRLIASAVIMLSAGLVTASAETLMMPDRAAKVGTQVVVWGVSDLANGTAYSIDFGDGSPVENGVVADRSYINTTHTYASSGLVTATLTVGAESATVDIAVFDPAALSASEAREVGINMAIEDGLRNLWYTQAGRAANFPASPITNWSGYDQVTALIAAAFQNHGYRLDPDPNVDPTGVYEKYIVRRSINYTIRSLRTINIGLGVPATQDNDPCVGAGIEPTPCTGLYHNFDPGYSTGLTSIALAASGALNRVVDAADVPGNFSGNYVVGKTYREILQRLVNALAWGQADDHCGVHRGGWVYQFNTCSSDGSTMGWAVLGLLDADASGITVPQWVKDEVALALTSGLNDNGGFDYRANGNAANHYLPTLEKGGIPLQAMFLTGEFSGARVDSVADYISKRWNSGRLETDYTGWRCSGVPGQFNKGCAYSMYNAFKGLQLQGIVTLPDVNRPAGPGGIPENDWYADYVDWAVANQNAPTSPTGGNWGPAMAFSCCYANDPMETAIIELILSKVALILPDPALFADFGLLPLTQDIELETTTDATVTARAVADQGADLNDPSDDTPVPGVQVSFLVIAGPSAGATGTGVTNANGEASFTYTYGGPPEGNLTDQVQAFVGDVNSDIPSNVVDVVWIGPNEPPVAVCQDVVRECVAGAFTNDVSDADFDGGSSDPDGDPLTFAFAPALPLALSPAADPSVVGTLTVSDPSGAQDMCVASFSTVDTTPPVLNVGFDPVAGVPGRFEVVIEADDLCGSNVDFTITRLRIARCGAINDIQNGQLIDYTPINAGPCSVVDNGGILEISAKSMTLRVVGVDEFDNTSSETVNLSGNGN